MLSMRLLVSRVSASRKHSTSGQAGALSVVVSPNSALLGMNCGFDRA